MQQKEDKKDLESQTLRYRILPLFSTQVQIHKLPLCSIQIIFEVIMFIQILKYPIDYFSKDWLGYYQAIFTYLDLSYYEKFMTQNQFQSTLLIVLVIITIYWMVTLALYIIDFKNGQTASNTKRLVLLIFSTILFLPIMNTILNLFKCSSNSMYFRPCFENTNSLLIFLSLFTFGLFTILIIIQTFIRFQFIQDKRIFKRIKNSSYISVGLIIYCIVNQLSFLFLQQMVKVIILDASIILMITIFVLKDQHYKEWTKLLQLNMLIVNAIPIVIINLIYFLKLDLNISILLVIWPITIISVQKMNLHTLQFELDNVNKWNTPAMMIRYTQSLRKLLNRKKQYYYQIFIHGYMQVHRQKCDNPQCPYNIQVPQIQSQMNNISLNKQQKSQQQIRTQNMIIKIFNDGCKIAPINPQLQLQYAHFLFDIDQKQSSLKHLLLIKYEDLPFDKYYKYVSMKNKIHNQMCQKPERQFLDLVSEIEVKRKQEQIIQKFQQAALINLQFWSVLNQDHPDFQKLNQIGSSRVRIGQQVRQRYQQICNYAHSQKITNLYIHFLTSIQNNQDMYNKLYEQIKKKYDLQQKIILQDWSNSSLATMLISIQTANFGTMIDLNSMCASMFGYQKYQLVNRHFKNMFSEELKDHIKMFLNPKIRQYVFFMSHKNTYLFKITRKIQTYNSMDTGMTSICTLNNIISLNSCFILFNKNQKSIGLSSSCITFLGIDNKIIQQSLSFKDIFNIKLQEIKKLSSIGNQTFKINQIIRINSQSVNLSYRKQPYTISYNSYSQGFFWIQFTVSRFKSQYKNKSVQIKKFQFQVQSTLNDLKYFGLSQSSQYPYLSQFSQINFAQSIKQKQKNLFYGDNITTLRLKENIIQVIEDNDDQLSQLNIKKQNDPLRQQIQNIARKDQEIIFSSKQSFQKFINEYKITKNIRLILLLGILLALGTYIAFYFIFKGHNQVTTKYFQQIAYQNLIIGSIARQYALMTTLQLMKANVSKRIPTSYYTVYTNNINQLQSIKLKGSKPYPLTTYITQNTRRQFYSDQFLLSFINYAIQMSAGMKGKTTQTQLVDEYQKIQTFKINYLKINGQLTRDKMYAVLQQRQNQILKQISNSMNIQMIMLFSGVLFLIIISIILAIVISKINDQKIRTLQVFLGITQQQIHKFSSKTQKFLISLHVEDTTGQVQVDDQNEQKKLNSSTFAKKKHFKLVKLGKSIYIKILLIPLLAQAFFIQSFLQSYTSLKFMYDSIPYIALTSKADYIFYSGIGTVQTAIYNKGTDQVGLTSDYLQYYRNYFDAHYETFGTIQSFHSTFTSVFMQNICNGKVNIPLACNIPFISSNGTLLVFTDITVRTQNSDFSQDFSNDYYIAFAVISSAHRFLTMLVLSEQKNLIVSFEQTLLNNLIIWIFVVIGVTIIYGLIVLNSFIKQVNLNKNMLALLPISIVKTLPDIKKYINMIIKSKGLS